MNTFINKFNLFLIHSFFHYLSILTFLPVLSFADPSNIDSLTDRLRFTKNDIEKIKILTELSTLQRNKDLEKSYSIANEAYIMSLNENNTKLRVQPLINMGIYHYMRGENAKAIDKYSEAEIIAEKLKDTLLIARILNNTGAVFQNIGEYNKAYNYFLTSLKLRETIGDKEGIGMSLNNLGALSALLGDKEKAMDFYQKALKNRYEINDINGIIYSLTNIGTAYFDLDSLETALEYYSQALEYSEKANNQYTSSTILLNMANIFKIKGNKQKYTELIDRSLLLKEQVQDLAGIATLYMNLGIFEMEEKKFIKSEKLFKKSLEIAENTGNIDIQKKVYNLLSTLYEISGDKSSALNYFKKYSSLKDSLFSYEKNSDIAKLQERYEIEKAIADRKRAEEERNRIEAEKTRLRNNLQNFAIVIILMSLFVFLFMTNKLKISRYYAEAVMFITFLFFFQFVNMWFDPVMEGFSKNGPLIKLLASSCLALLILPFDKYLRRKIAEKVLS